MKLSSLIPYFILLLPALCQADGLTLGATRMIYEAGRKEASVPLRNGVRDTPHLVQSWVSDFDRRSTDNIPFITTPPLFKLAAGGESPVRVVYVGSGASALAKDKESLFLLNIRAIPAVATKQNPARLTIATQNIIKLIYRPPGLTAREASAAGEKLQVSATAGRVTFKNPTPYVITLTNVTVNSQKIENPSTIRPFSSQAVSVQTSPVRNVTWSTINDWGGITQPHKVSF